MHILMSFAAGNGAVEMVAPRLVCCKCDHFGPAGPKSSIDVVVPNGYAMCDVLACHLQAHFLTLLDNHPSRIKLELACSHLDHPHAVYDRARQGRLTSVFMHLRIFRRVLVMLFDFVSNTIFVLLMSGHVFVATSGPDHTKHDQARYENNRDNCNHHRCAFLSHGIPSC